MNLQYLTYIKTSLLSMIAVTLPFALIEQFIYFEAKKSPSRMALGIVGLAFSLLESFLVFLALGRVIRLLQTEKDIDPTTYIKEHFRDLVIETFRAMGRIAVGFLLIIPGILRATRYYLIPFIVQFDEKYQKGEVDALSEANLLLKGRFLRFFGALCLTQIVMFGIQVGAVNFSLFVAPVQWFLLYFVELILQAAIFLYFYKYYIWLKSLQTEV